MPEILKYTIKEKLDNTVAKAEKSRFVSSLCQQLNISESHFRKIQNYKQGDDNEISAWQMKVIAEALGCAMEDLFTKVEQQPEAA